MRHKPAPARAPSPSAVNAGPTTLHFQIDRITLEGAAPSARNRFEASLRAEFARAHYDQEWSTMAGVKLDRLDAGQLPSGASPEESAQHIAREIFAKLTSGGMHHA